MKNPKIQFFTTLIVAAIVGGAIAWFIFKPKSQPPATEQVATQAQPVVQPQPGQGPASGKDTIVMIFNKQSAQQILGALQNQFPTPQNAPNLTVSQFLATQQVFNYLQGVIIKKWADLAPKPAAPTPPAAKTK